MKKEIEVEMISYKNLHYDVSKSHLMTLNPGNKVADGEVDNAYFELLMERDKRYFETENVASHFLMASEFMEVANFYVQKCEQTSPG